MEPPQAARTFSEVEPRDQIGPSRIVADLRLQLADVREVEVADDGDVADRRDGVGFRVPTEDHRAFAKQDAHPRRVGGQRVDHARVARHESAQAARAQGMQ